MKKKNNNVISPNVTQKKQNNITQTQPTKAVDVTQKAELSAAKPTNISISRNITIGLLIGIIGFVGFWILKDFLLQKKTFLFLDIGSDTINAVFPFNKLIVDYFHEYGLPSWSFRQGMGQDISPLLNSPLYYLFFLGNPENIPTTIVYIEFIRIFLNGLVFFWYLKTITYNNYTSILGAVCFSIMGYLTLALGWGPLLADWQLFLVFTLVSIEYIIRHDKWLYLPIAVMLIAIGQPFNFVIIAEFCLVYLFVRLYSENELADWATNGKLLLKIGGLGVLGIGMGFFLFYSHILTILNSPRGSGDVALTNVLSSQPILQTADSIELFTSFLRWFGNDILGYAANYRAWQNYMEAPAFYIGLGMLLLIPQLFVLSNRRQRIAYGIVAGIFLFIMLFPFFRYAFWLFTGNYYRMMAMFMAVGLLLGSLKVIEAILKGFKINLYVLAATFIFLVFLLYYNFSDDLSALINKPLRTLVLVYLLFHTLILGATRFEAVRKIMLFGFLGLTLIEMAYFGSLTLSKREILSVNDYKSRNGFNDYTKEALEYINKQDKSFFRVEKSYTSGNAAHTSLNDAMIQNYRSTSNYYSFNHRNYVAFMKGLDVIQASDETATRWISGVRGRPLLMPLTSIKYYLVKGQFPFQRFGFDSLTTFQDVKVFKNTFSLPMGFTYDQYITEDNFRKMSIVQKDIANYRSFVIKNDEKAKYSTLTETKDSLQTILLDDYKKLIDERKADTLQMTSHNETHFEGNINLNRSKLLFLTIPFDKGWKAEVDGKPANINLVTFGMSGILLNKGKHQVKVYYEAPYFKLGSMISGISILLYGLLIGFIYYRKKQKPSPNTDELSTENTEPI